MQTATTSENLKNLGGDPSIHASLSSLSFPSIKQEEESPKPLCESSSRHEAVSLRPRHCHGEIVWVFIYCGSLSKACIT